MKVKIEKKSCQTKDIPNFKSEISKEKEPAKEMEMESLMK